MSYNPSNPMFTGSNKPYATQGQPDTAKSWFYDQTTGVKRPFNTTTEILEYFDTAIKRKGVTGAILVNESEVGEYWWPDPSKLTNDDLVKKGSDNAGIALIPSWSDDGAYKADNVVYWFNNGTRYLFACTADDTTTEPGTVDADWIPIGIYMQKGSYTGGDITSDGEIQSLANKTLLSVYIDGIQKSGFEYDFATGKVNGFIGYESASAIIIKFLNV